MQRHWHAYTRTGPREERARPDDRWPGTATFDTAVCVPGKPRHWLARPADQIAETFNSPETGADWLVTEYTKVSAECVGAHTPVEKRHALALRLLSGGEDADWNEELLAGRYWVATVVACPNKRADHPCPLPESVRDGTP